MIYIAERLAFVHGDATKAALIESAHSQWGRRPQFQWVEQDNVIKTDFDTHRLRSGASDLLETQPIIGPVNTYMGHFEQTSSVGPFSGLLDLGSEYCNSALESRGPYQECSTDPFDLSSSRDARSEGAAEMLAGTETTSTKAITFGIGHPHTFSLGQKSPALQSQMAHKTIELCYASCRMCHSVELLNSHDGCCEACSLNHSPDLHWPAMDDDVMNGDQKLCGTDSHTLLGTGPLHRSAVDQDDELIPGTRQMHAENPAHSRSDTSSAPWVSDNWPSRGGMTSDIPPSTSSRGQSIVMSRPCPLGAGKSVTSERLSELIDTESIKYSDWGPWIGPRSDYSFGAWEIRLWRPARQCDSLKCDRPKLLV